jgi:replicative DNA helicase
MNDAELQIADYESALLRAVKSHPRLVDELGIRRELFQDTALRAVFSAIVAVLNDELEVEEVNLAAELRKANQGDLVSFMAGLASASPANAAFYVDKLREAATRRRLAPVLRDAAGAIEAGGSLAEISNAIELGLHDMASGGHGITPASFGDYFTARVAWDPRLDFRPQLFNSLPFPRGTVSYIGARTARGKSAVLVNLAREALLRSRRAVYISLELSPAQLFDRLILSTARAAAGEALRSEKPLPELYALMKSGRGQGELLPKETPFSRAILPALEEIRSATQKDRLSILDARGYNLAAILSAIRTKAKEGDLVLLDYIQRLPSKDGAASEGYERMKAVSDAVINAAVSRNVVLIAAAQFNRQGGAPSQDDTFSDASFRESGDLEQDAHNAIGLGWTADKKGRFYEILKARESAGTGDAFKLEWDGAFQYLAHTGERYIATRNEAAPRAGKNPTKKDQIPTSLPGARL